MWVRRKILNLDDNVGLGTDIPLFGGETEREREKERNVKKRRNKETNNETITPKFQRETKDPAMTTRFPRDAWFAFVRTRPFQRYKPDELLITERPRMTFKFLTRLYFSATEYRQEGAVIMPEICRVTIYAATAG